MEQASIIEQIRTKLMLQDAGYCVNVSILEQWIFWTYMQWTSL